MLLDLFCVVLLVVVLLWWLRRRPTNVVGVVDEALASSLLGVVDCDDPNELGPVGEWEDLGDLDQVTEQCVSHETPGRGEAPKRQALKRVRRGFRRPFVAYWVNWGKAQFPSAWRGASDADRVCITNALVREMRSRSVRDFDISRVKDEVVLGILLPNAAEVRVARMEATLCVEERQQSARGLVNRGGGSGLQLGRAK
nr:hypothetical protein 1 [Ginkgo biloba tombusvirus]